MAWREPIFRRLKNFDDDGLPVSLASLRKPFAHRSSKARGIDTLTGLERAVTGRKRVVEFRRAGEISHTETIEPIERHRTALIVDSHFDA
jgi:hypothetical protein